jgi:hypothetical protein
MLDGSTASTISRGWRAVRPHKPTCGIVWDRLRHIQEIEGVDL